MIISHKYKYIFLKTTKTAGTSIEISLSRFCGLDDIITPISFSDELIRKKLGIFPKNYENYTCPLKLEEDNSQLKANFWNHIKAKEIKDRIGTKIWNSYFKFCFVRNPWDRAISQYYWVKRKIDQPESLDKFIKRRKLNRNFNIYTIDGKIALDYIGKYESLIEDLSLICDKLGIPFDKWLPKAKANFRQDRRHYSEILTKEQIEFIREKCIKEIELFGY